MSTPTAPRDDAFMFDPGAETLSRDALTALQVERAKRTLEHAYAKVPLYRQRFDAAGVKPGDFKALTDIARFPFTLKTDLRDNYPFGMFAVPREQLLRVHASSGTTGKPTVVGYSKRELDAHYGAERLGCTVVPMSGGGTERQVALLNDFGARVLCSTPSYAANIA